MRVPVKVISRWFVWRLWYFFAVFVALFGGGLPVGFGNDSSGLLATYLLRVLLLVYVFFAKLLLLIFCWYFFCKNCWCCFFRLDEFCSVFGRRLLLLMLCVCYAGFSTNLLCVLLLVWIFFAQFLLIIFIAVFWTTITVAELYRLNEFCAPAGSCLGLLMLWDYYSESNTNLLCVLLIVWIFFTQFLLIIYWCHVCAQLTGDTFLSFARVFGDCWFVFAFVRL